jgi:hypothetical protein
MACIASLNKADDGSWVGRTVDGQTKIFATLPQYRAYVASIDSCKPIQAWTPGVTTSETGFKEFTPRDSLTQAKYDATSVTWEGPDSSDAAVARGVYSLDSADAARRELRTAPLPASVNPPPKPLPAPAPSSCVIV